MDGHAPSVDHQHDDPHDQKRIGNIGNIWPDFGVAAGPCDAEWESDTRQRVDEITHAREYQAIIKIAQSTCDDESKACVGHPIDSTCPFEKERDRDDASDQRKDHKEPSLPGTDPEDRARVEYQCELKDIVHDRDWFVRWDQNPQVRDAEDVSAIDFEREPSDMLKRVPLGPQISDEAEARSQQEHNPSPWALCRGGSADGMFRLGTIRPFFRIKRRQREIPRRSISRAAAIV